MSRLSGNLIVLGIVLIGLCGLSATNIGSSVVDGMLFEVYAIPTRIKTSKLKIGMTRKEVDEIFPIKPGGSSEIFLGLTEYCGSNYTRIKVPYKNDRVSGPAEVYKGGCAMD